MTEARTGVEYLLAGRPEYWLVNYHPNLATAIFFVIVAIVVAVFIWRHVARRR